MSSRKLQEHTADSNLGRTGGDRPIVVAWFVVLFVLAIGVANGAGYHSVYLLQGIAKADPSFLRGDWFTWDTVPAHEAFGLLVALISLPGRLEVGLTFFAVAQSAVLAIVVYYGIRAVYDRPLVPWALTLLLLSAVGARGIGLTRLINPHMQASAIGGVCFVTGLVLLAWDRRFRAGVAFGLGGMIHAQFAVLTLAVLAVMTLAEPRPRKPFLVSVCLPFLALSSYSLTMAVQYGLAPAPEQSTTIALARFPHHLVPSSWSPSIYAVFLVVILVGIGGWLVRRPRPNRRLSWSVMAISLIVLSSVIIGYLQVLDAVNLAFPWRLSTVMVLVSIALGSAALCAPELYRPRTSLLISGAVVAVVLLVGASRILPGRVVAAMITALLVPVSVALGRRWQHAGSPAKVAEWLPLLVISVGFIPPVVHGLELSHLGLRPEDPTQNDLYEWVRSSAPEGEIFAVPPGWKDFRLVAERPIIVDHVAVPLNSKQDLQAWFDRLSDLTGIRPANNLEELDAAFFEMDCERAADLRSVYGLRFVVRDSSQEFGCGVVVYADDRYSVVDLRS
jgi:hypothetical protein